MAETLIDRIYTDRLVFIDVVSHLLAQVRKSSAQVNFTAPVALAIVQNAPTAAIIALTETSKDTPASSVALTTAPHIASSFLSPEHASHAAEYSDSAFNTYREPRTIQQELNGGKRKSTPLTHYDGIPMSVIQQPPDVTSTHRPLHRQVSSHTDASKDRGREIVTPKRLARAFQCLSVGARTASEDYYGSESSPLASSTSFTSCDSSISCVSSPVSLCLTTDDDTENPR